MSYPILTIKLKVLLQNLQTMHRNLPSFKIFYAVKANPHSEIIRLLESNGSFFETASLEEVEHLLRLGIDSEKILCSNPVKSFQSASEIVSKGVTTLVIDSLEEISKTEHLNCDILLRIYVPNTGSLWKLDKKFGAYRKAWPAIFQRLKEKKVNFVGVTFHVGSQCTSLRNWDKALRLALKAVKLSRNYGLAPKTLNIGGGFPVFLGKEVISPADIYQTIQKHLERFRSLGIREFWAEPGRFLVASSGSLKTEIIGVSKRNGLKWVYLNCGIFSGLMESIEGKIQYPVESEKEGPHPPERVMLCGPTCDGMDVLYKTFLPAPAVGDKLHFKGAGAYTTVYASSFNGFKPPEIRIEE